MSSKSDNLLINIHPELLSEWDYEKNEHDGIDVNTITCGSVRKAWWRCSAYRHSYKATVNNRVSSGSGCPFCSGRKALTGYNDLQTLCPELISSEWDWIKNNADNIRPDTLLKNSHVKASWLCVQYKHSYEMTIANKTTGHGCPFCTGNKVLPGFNDLLTCFPELINNEWDWIKNNADGIRPDELTSYSNKKTYWHCNICNGSYLMNVCKKTIYHRKCPFCAGKKILIGFNDLQSCYPDIAKEWYQPLNGSITPDIVTKGSNIIRIPDPKHPNKTISVKPAWKCRKCEHIWRATVNNRTRSMIKSGCPACAHRVSKQENQVADYMNNYLCEHYNNMNYTMLRSIKFKRIYKMLNINTNSILSDDLQSHLLKELDIYIPEFNLAIEYDGDYWHEDKIMMETRGLTNSEAHSIKQSLCKKAGITLLFITEHDWLNNNDDVKNSITTLIDKTIRV